MFGLRTLNFLRRHCIYGFSLIKVKDLLSNKVEVIDFRFQ